jgi:hypothetical protein
MPIKILVWELESDRPRWPHYCWGRRPRSTKRQHMQLHQSAYKTSIRDLFLLHYPSSLPGAQRTTDLLGRCYVGIGEGLVVDLMYECIVCVYVRVQSML